MHTNEVDITGDDRAEVILKIKVKMNSANRNTEAETKPPKRMAASRKIRVKSVKTDKCELKTTKIHVDENSFICC